jgi:UDP-N-acetylmuramoyl-L-alanyl-D-glutamate--2,6-diaminopimelate ligase
MKVLSDILKNIEIVEQKGDTSIAVSGIYTDSRKLSANGLFVALRGTQTDGHQFIGKAIQNGATAVICENLPENPAEDIVYVIVKNSAVAFARAAASFYDNPADKLKIIGITGTNGKTTIATLLYNMFNNLGIKSALISTVAYYIDDEVIPASHTTPDALKLHELFALMLSKNCEYCFMEVSSHAIDQKRVEGINFTGAVFTNLTHDHLDYHKNFKNYRDTKKQLFDNLNKNAFALINADDKNGHFMLQNTKAKKYTYSLNRAADYKTKTIEAHLNSTLIEINGIEIWTLFTGDFNTSNLTAVYAVADILGVEKEQIALQISKLQPVSGRFETIKINDITGIVDYAHTPDALENVLKTINAVKNNTQNIITVVGAGGDRDKTKRPVMAKVAVENSDKVILTSDNPRTEPPTNILDDMERGISPAMQKKMLRITDRKEAIKTACLIANSGDIVLIAGKGHENYQEIKGKRHHFDDKEVFIEMMKVLNS